jgi:hypothetical protein
MITNTSFRPLLKRGAELYISCDDYILWVWDGHFVWISNIVSIFVWSWCIILNNHSNACASSIYANTVMLDFTSAIHLWAGIHSPCKLEFLFIFLFDKQLMAQHFIDSIEVWILISRSGQRFIGRSGFHMDPTVGPFHTKVWWPLYIWTFDCYFLKKLGLRGLKTTPCGIELRRKVFSHWPRKPPNFSPLLPPPLDRGLTAEVRAGPGQHTAGR